MPTYQYACSKCGDEFEVYQSFSDAPLERHQGCGGQLQKVFAPVGIVLKGSGFYKTDNRAGSKSKSSESKSDAGSTTTTETTSESKSTSESKQSDASSNGSSAKNGSGTSSGKPTKPAKSSA
jgi:putative FmdB family regulatory protein